MKPVSSLPLCEVRWFWSRTRQLHDASQTPAPPMTSRLRGLTRALEARPQAFLRGAAQVQLFKDELAAPSNSKDRLSLGSPAETDAAAKHSSKSQLASMHNRRHSSLPAKPIADIKQPRGPDQPSKTQQTGISRRRQAEHSEIAAAVLELQARLQQPNALNHAGSAPAAPESHPKGALPSAASNQPPTSGPAFLAPAAYRKPHAAANQHANASATRQEHCRAAPSAASKIPRQQATQPVAPAATSIQPHIPATFTSEFSAASQMVNRAVTISASAQPTAALPAPAVGEALSESPAMPQQSSRGSAALIVTEATRKAAFRGDWKALLYKHRQDSVPASDSLTLSDELDLAFNQLPDTPTSGGLDWSGKARVASLPHGQGLLDHGDIICQPGLRIPISLNGQELEMQPIWLNIHQPAGSSTARIYEGLAPISEASEEQMQQWPSEAFHECEGRSFSQPDLRSGDWSSYLVAVTGELADVEEDVLWPNQVVHRDRTMYNARSGNDIAIFLADPSQEHMDAHLENLRRLQEVRHYRPAWCFHMLRLRWGAAALDQYGISLSSIASKEAPDGASQHAEAQERKASPNASSHADRTHLQQQGFKREPLRQSAAKLGPASALQSSRMARQSAALPVHRSGSLRQQVAA